MLSLYLSVCQEVSMLCVDCKTKFRHRQKLEIARLSSDGLSLTLAHNHKLNSIIIKNDVVYAYSSNLASIENTPI
jgi:hypothetical protein